jgi:sporadic carbohydrate cluster 2OG-Fe(II) oxygenase
MSFLSGHEKKICSKFLRDGYILFNIKQKKKIDFIKEKIFFLTKNFLKKNYSNLNKKNIYNNIQDFVQLKDLNSFRLHLINSLNKISDFRKIYYEIGKEYLDVICGNELVMQNKINLSIQLPNDDSSLLPIHSDVWAGNSPFEVVLWIPLVNCKKTQSMFILNPKDNNYYYSNLKKFNTSDKIYNHCEKKLNWLEINYGQGLIFSQVLLHGNTINKEKESRWSFNCRFKSVFSPFEEKGIGDFFSPITLKPASKLGIDYNEPSIK